MGNANFSTQCHIERILDEHKSFATDMMVQLLKLKDWNLSKL